MDRPPDTKQSTITMSTRHLNADQAIGELLTAADETSRRIISAYDQSCSHGKNVTLLSSAKFSADALEHCANFLGLKTRDAEDNKIYSNKPTIADRIILKIESFFESECADCAEKYRVKLGDEPKLQCFLCFQGSHNCEKITALNISQTDTFPIGNVWLCSGCHEKNNLLAPNKSRKRSNSTSGNSVTFSSENNETVQTNSKQTDNSNSNSEDAPNTKPSHNEPICPLYLKNSCPHGTSGKKLIDHKECEKFHPKRCHRFVKEGPRSKRGCKKGKNCDHYHPVLCKYSVRNRRCTNKECTFVHLRGTKRWPESEDRTRRNDTQRHDSQENGVQGNSRSGSRAERTPSRNRSTSSRPATNQAAPRTRGGQDERTAHSYNTENIAQLIQGIRGDFQKELELIRTQMFYLKQPAPPPWTGSFPCYPPQMEFPSINPQTLENQNVMHQIPQHQIPLYKDMLLRQQSCS